MVKITTKKISAVGMATLLLGTPLAAFADSDNTTIDIDTSVEVNISDLEEEILEAEIETEVDVNETQDSDEDLSEEEKSYFLTEEGAALKWEQLSLRLEARVENSKTLIEEVPEESPIDTNELERIHKEFERLLLEIQSVEVETTTNSDLVSLYISYKKEIITLSQEFKVEYTKGINEERREELKEKIEAKKEEIQERREDKLQDLKVKHNLKNLAQVYSSISGLSLEELRTQYEAGEISVDDVKLEVRTYWDSLSEEEKEEARERIKEEKTKLEILIKERNKEIRENFKERIEALKEERKEKVEELKEERKEVRIDTQQQIRALKNQDEFRTIQEKFDSLTPEQQEVLKNRAEQLDPNEQEKLNKLAEKFLSGEELSEEDLAEVEVIVEANGGIRVE